MRRMRPFRRIPPAGNLSGTLKYRHSGSGVFWLLSCSAHYRQRNSGLRSKYAFQYHLAFYVNTCYRFSAADFTCREDSPVGLKRNKRQKIVPKNTDI